MKIRIYQIDPQKDDSRKAYLGLKELHEQQGNCEIDSNIYQKVYEGEVDCQDLQAVYQRFNLDKPDGFTGHSLSVSDVVLVEKSTAQVTEGSYFCDAVGFEKVKFTEPEEEAGIEVLYIEPLKEPKRITIRHDLETLQSMVGGYIEEYMPFEDEVALICNDEGKLNGLPLNRAIYEDMEQGKKERCQDIIAGSFLVVYAPWDSENFQSLPPELMEKYEKLFRQPEIFYRTGTGIKAVPYVRTVTHEEREER